MIGHDRNQTTKVADQSAHHTGGESFNRSRIGGASGGVEPRLPGTVCRAVPSGNCRESATDMLLGTDEQPIQDTVPFEPKHPSIANWGSR
jgi:hypothetical protein